MNKRNKLKKKKKKKRKIKKKNEKWKIEKMKKNGREHLTPIRNCGSYGKVDEERNKPQTDYYSPKSRENDDKNAVAVVKIVPQWGCVSLDSDALVSQRGKRPRGNPMQKVVGSIPKVRGHLVYATSSKFPGREKAIAWEKYNYNILISEVPTLCNLRTGPTKRLKDNSDVPLPKYIQAQRRRQNAEDCVVPAASTKGPEERKFVVDSGAYGQ